MYKRLKKKKIRKRLVILDKAFNIAIRPSFLSKIIVVNVFMNTSSSSDGKSCCSQYDCLLFILCSPESPSLPAPSKLDDLVQKRT